MLSAGRRVVELAAGLDAFPAYITDLAGLRRHVRRVWDALPTGTELFYPVRANPDPRVLAALAATVDGMEVASAGELAHVRASVPDARLAFGGPGKTTADLELALRLGVECFHVAGELELRRLGELCDRHEVSVRVLLRISPFGGDSGLLALDPAAADDCLPVLRRHRRLRLRGVQLDLGSGLDTDSAVALADRVIGWTRGWAASRGVRVAEVNLGGGMGVDYVEPEHTFDWEVYGAALARLVAPIRPTVLRIQPGRAMTAYAGSYVTRVLDLRGGYAVVQGGTHHLPAGPDRPFRVLPVPHWDGPGSRPEVIGAPVTVVGQLGTARDVLARRVKVDRLRVGDLLVFELAGAYAWHTAAHDFLMHPPPSFHYLD